MRQGRLEALAPGLAALAVALGIVLLVSASRRQAGRHRRLRPARDYSARSGFARPPAEMRGVALARKARPLEAAV